MLSLRQKYNKKLFLFSTFRLSSTYIYQDAERITLYELINMHIPLFGSSLRYKSKNQLNRNILEKYAFLGSSHPEQLLARLQSTQ